MTTEARKRVLRYAIAADLVILVTGIGLLFPRVSGDAMVAMYLAAVALAGWKGGGWRGSIFAMLLSLVAAGPLFGTMDAWHAGVFAGASVVLAVVAAIVRLKRRSRTRPPGGAAALAPILTFGRNGEAEPRPGAEAERFPRDVEGRTAAEPQAVRAPAERMARETDKKLARERETARIAAEKKQADEQRAAAEKEAAALREASRIAAEKLAEEQRIAAEKKLAEEREAARREAERVTREAEERAARLASEKKLAEERRLAEEKKLTAKIDAARREGEEKAARESEAVRSAAEPGASAGKKLTTEEPPDIGAQPLVAQEKAVPDPNLPAVTLARTPETSQPPEPGLLGRMSQWMRPGPKPPLTPNPASHPAGSDVAAPAGPPKPVPPKARERRPRILLLEKRRGTADMVLPKARENGIDMEVVERWVDAVDELLRFHPDLFFLDCELPDFDKVYAAVRENARDTPIILTAKQNAAVQPVACAGTVTRPYEIDVLAGLARSAVSDPKPFLERQAAPPAPPGPSPEVIAPEEPAAAVVSLGAAPPVAPLPEVIAPKVEPLPAEVAAIAGPPPAPPAEAIAPKVEEPPAPSVPAIAALPAEVIAPRAELVGSLISEEVVADEPAEVAAPSTPIPPPPPAPSPEVIAPREEEQLAADVASIATPRPATSPELTSPADEPIATAATPDASTISPPAGPLPVEELLAAAMTSEESAPDDADLGGFTAVCFNCREEFDAMEADWCGCLTRERSLVCTNCLTCFCKATPAYWETFWTSAPPRLFARRAAERQRRHAPFVNPAPGEAVRPLVMLAEDDENIQAVAQRVCQNLGYGFVVAGNGEEGLRLARLHQPNLILSDTFMPGLDGREMCRILKGESLGGGLRTVVMTGLYTDTRYRREALARFHVDEYLTKPVSITDLINLLQKHIEGVAGLPAQEDLHTLHRKEIEEGQRSAKSSSREAGAQGLLPLGLDALPAATPAREHYEILCFNCNRPLDAAHAEWCGDQPDPTLVCDACGHCFCKAPAAWRERFWIGAPVSLFERRLIAEARSVVAHGNAEPGESRRPLILLVAHDEDAELLVRSVVTSFGYGFEAVAEGQQGLALARRLHPDLMLADAFLPNLDGREVCRLLKDDPALAEMKAVLMTGRYTDRGFRHEAQAVYKVDDFLPRPLAAADLLQLIRKHLHPARARDGVRPSE